MTEPMSDPFDAITAEWDGKIADARQNHDPSWSVTGFKGHNTRDGVAFVAKLRKDGKIVGYIEQAGQGGDTRIDWQHGWRDPNAALWETEAARFDTSIGGGVDILLEALIQKGGR